MVQDHNLGTQNDRSNSRIVKSREKLRLGILAETMNDLLIRRCDSLCYFSQVLARRTIYKRIIRERSITSFPHGSYSFS